MPMLPDGENVTAPVPSPQTTPPSTRDNPLPLDTPLSLQVQFDQVDEAVTLFQENADRLSALIDRGRHDLITMMRPMGNDEVSKDAVEGFAAAGQTHLEAITGYRDWLQAIVDDLRASAEKYRSADGATAGNLRGVAGG